MMGINGRKGRAQEMARIRRDEIKQAKAAGIDVTDRRAVRAFHDAKWDALVVKYARKRAVPVKTDGTS